jgi:uncharacterized protein (DUF1778 family)
MSKNRPAEPNVTIRVVARADQRELIDLAATYVGKSRSEFMLSNACREAEVVLVDQTLFSINTPVSRKSGAMLDATRNEGLRDLMSTKAPWER